jgi:hypothetical protein
MRTLLLLALVLPGGQTAPKDTPVQAEITRLGACRPTFKMFPPPMNMRAVWTQPFDLVSAPDGAHKVSIEFTMQYAVSNNFATQEEAAKAEDFNPTFNLRQRNHYAVDGDHLRLLWRESFLNSHWKRQRENQPEFACWQTLPNSTQ